MTGFSRGLWLFFGAALLAAGGHAAPAKAGARTAPTKSPQFAARWVYASHNLLVPEEIQKVQDLMRRAKAAGYNGIVLADSKLSLLDRMDERYFKNVETLKATAKELGIDIIPTVCPIGYSNALLAHDPNLAEGLPVKDANFVVSGKTAVLAPDPDAVLKNGDFEASSGNKMSGWAMQDYPGQATFVDTEVTHGGRQSLRMQDIGKADPQNGHGRLMQTVAVKPWRQYHFSVWVKTRDFETPSEARVQVLTDKEDALSFPQWGVERTQDWKQYHLVFNSQGNTHVNIYMGVWNGKGGTIWWDDAQMEEVGLLNVLRRAGCPLVVKGEDGTVYEEGKDYEPVRDERLGTVPWDGAYEIYHPAPPIRLTANSRITDGQPLRVSFYHAITIYDFQVPCCLSDQKVYDLLQDQIHRVNALFHPKAFFMAHDEIRVANWCETCQKRHMTPGQLLADNVRRCIGMIRKENPKANIYVWSDMFDPTHNATQNTHYYLVNGPWYGSWKGLAPDTRIVNWFFDGRKKSLDWIAKRGHKQVIAGYYDVDPEQFKLWKEAATGVPGVNGAMYTTWVGGYNDLEAFAKVAWGTP